MIHETESKGSPTFKTMPNFINKEEIKIRLERCQLVINDPVALHDNPNTKATHWYGIGPVVNQKVGMSLYDVRLSTKEAYSEVKKLLTDACAEIGLDCLDKDFYHV